MGDQFIGEIRLFSFGKIPNGWHICDGTILQINQNQALFALLGYAFGGTPAQTFALPDLRGRAVLGTTFTAPYTLGSKGGAETVALVTNQVAAHNHQFGVVNANGKALEPGDTLAIPTDATNIELDIYTNDGKTLTQLTNSIQPTGGQAHNNMQPFLVANYCIAVVGIFPPRS